MGDRKEQKKQSCKNDKHKSKIIIILLLIIILISGIIYMNVYNKTKEYDEKLSWNEEVKGAYESYKDDFKYETKEELVDTLKLIKTILKDENIKSYEFKPTIEEYQSSGITTDPVHFGYYYISAEFNVEKSSVCKEIINKLKNSNLPKKSYYFTCNPDLNDTGKNDYSSIWN